VGDECLLRVNVTYPRNFLEVRVKHSRRSANPPLNDQPGRGGGVLAQGDARHRPPFPLAIFSSGFLVESRQYQSYADRLASWGYVVLTYDKVENVTSNRNDVVTACFIKDLIDWAASSAALGPITDTSRVLLCGHSRGGKVRASHRLSFVLQPATVSHQRGGGMILLDVSPAPARRAVCVEVSRRPPLGDRAPPLGKRVMCASYSEGILRCGGGVRGGCTGERAGGRAGPSRGFLVSGGPRG
jgi:hypothetical protein